MKDENDHKEPLGRNEANGALTDLVRTILPPYIHENSAFGTTALWQATP